MNEIKITLLAEKGRGRPKGNGVKRIYTQPGMGAVEEYKVAPIPNGRWRADWMSGEIVIEKRGQAEDTGGFR